MISGLCSAYQVLGHPQHLELALRAAGFIKSTMWNPEERVLYRSAYRGADDGKIHQLEPPIKGYGILTNIHLSNMDSPFMSESSSAIYVVTSSTIDKKLEITKKNRK